MLAVPFRHSTQQNTTPQTNELKQTNLVLADSFAPANSTPPYAVSGADTARCGAPSLLVHAGVCPRIRLTFQVR